MGILNLNSGVMNPKTAIPDFANGVDAPVGNTYRGALADIFYASDIAREDWQRNEQSANNQLKRDLYMYDQQKEFTREQWAFEKNLSDTSYQRAVEDLKKAGLNPVLAVTQGAASTPSVSGASPHRSSGGYSSPRGTDSMGLLSTIISALAGMYTSGAKNATTLAAGAAKNDTALRVADANALGGMRRDAAWRKFYDKRKKL